MIRPFIPLDALRCALLGNSEKVNRAYPLRSLLANRPSTAAIFDASLSGMFFRKNARAWVWHQGNKVNALASAGERSGRQAWEVTHLFFRGDVEADMIRIFDRVSSSAGSHHAEKVFIRLLRGDPLVDIARQSGFFPRIPETLFVRTASRNSAAYPALPKTPIVGELSPIAPSDEHGLFRLYNATTPSEVRYAIGMTIDQWSASREYPGGRILERVVRNNRGLQAWLRTSRKLRIGEIAVEAHPDLQSSVPAILAEGLSVLRSANRVYCLAAEHQISLRRALVERGFLPVSDHVTLVKTMTVAAESRSRVTVAAPT